MFSNFNMFKSTYAKRSLLGVIISLSVIVAFYYVKNYYMVALTLIGSEALIASAVYAKAIALVIFGHVSIIFHIMVINIFIRIFVSVAVLSFVSGLYLIYYFIANANQHLKQKIGFDSIKNKKFNDYLDLQHAYLFNSRLKN